MPLRQEMAQREGYELVDLSDRTMEAENWTGLDGRKVAGYATKRLHRYR